MLRAEVTVEAVGIDTLAYGRFVTSIQEPSRCWLWNSPAGPIWLEFDAAPADEILDRLLGGPGMVGQSRRGRSDRADRAGRDEARTLTEIDKLVLNRLAELVARLLSKTLEMRIATRDFSHNGGHNGGRNGGRNGSPDGNTDGDLDGNTDGDLDGDTDGDLDDSLDDSLDDDGGQPAGPPTLQPNESFRRASFAIHVAGCCDGSLRLGLPAVQGDALFAQGRKDERPDGQPARAGAAELSVVAQNLGLQPEQLADLAAGDVLITDIPHDSEVLVRIDGDDRFAGKLGSRNGKRAVILARPIEDNQPDKP